MAYQPHRGSIRRVSWLAIALAFILGVLAIILIRPHPAHGVLVDEVARRL
jgi:hypothetical protein